LAYSAEYVERPVFSEVHMHDPAWISLRRLRG
jgi:hypothetical protein